ncbi:hypothetical protein SISNIDRAFT_456676 [Sistotremastrum niveocremeum HHB9708]|uniref:Nephrocystin 3-like N-terminal domain-containing protein n=1 Tax=Sistotremastrum niveocremeum HHB9708 TaxID=1314777 RepID=A0A164SF19_9AGAM|nr:hypothetical protein SISNIDRAFT_456676 [Sistotremastrum niveocremeum HHB9708]
MNLDLLIHELSGLPGGEEHSLAKFYILVRSPFGEARLSDVKNGSVSEAPLRISAENDETDIEVVVGRVKRLRAHAVLGRSVRKVRDLLCQGDEVNKIHITFEEGVHSSCLSLVLSAQPTLLQDLQVTLDASEANAKTLRPARHSDVLSRAPDISILEDSAWVQLFKLFNISDQIMSVVDEFAKIHPLLNVAWKLMTVAYKMIRSQQKRNGKIVTVVKAMVELYSFAEDSSAAVRMIEAKALFEEIIQETVAFAQFLSQYVRRSFARRVVSGAFSGVDDVIEKFDNRFRNLHFSFTTGVAMNTHELARETYHRNRVGFISVRLPYVKLAGSNVADKLTGDIEEEKANCPVYWLTGEEGSGKSSIATSLVDQCCDAGFLIAPFFFQRGHKERGSPQMLFTTFAIDLSFRDIDLADKIAFASRPGSDIIRLRDQFKNLVVNPLRSTPLLCRVLLVIDGLDQSGTRDERNELLYAITDMAPSLPDHVRLLITSREEEDITTIFKAHLSGSYIHERMDTKSEENNRDLEIYATRRFADLASWHSLAGKPDIQTGWPGDDRRNAFLRSCDGNFGKAASTFRHLQRAWKPDSELNVYLEKFLPSVTGESES